MLLLAPSDGVINERLAAELAEVESRFAAELLSDLPCVNDLVAHVERYRGKMLRPTLVLLSAMATASHRSEPTEDHRIIATVLEMVHMATLVHDDILDEAQMRRGGATLNHLAGNEAAVMLGDYLISHAYHLCSSLNRPDVSQIIARVTNTICEGELLQLANRNNWALDERTYFEIIRRKTACLSGVCCRLAAMINEAEPATVAALDSYGEKLGVAFQIIDDLLDLTGEEKTVGKTLGRDLEKGKLTLPLIHCLATAAPDQRQALVSLLDRARASAGSAQPEPALHDRLAQIQEQLRRSGSVAYARQHAARLIQMAKAGLVEHLPDSPARSLMLEMADAVLVRRS
ncbi:MAG TPA: polyprenyl synthetase family protein [Phycisphaeraceae bacterium]